MLTLLCLLLWKNHLILKRSWRLIFLCVVCEIAWFMFIHRHSWIHRHYLRLPAMPLELDSIKERPIHIFYTPSTDFTDALLRGARRGRNENTVQLHSYDNFMDMYHAVYNIPMLGYVVGIHFTHIETNSTDPPKTLSYEIWESFNISSTYQINKRTVRKRKELSSCERVMCIQAAIDKSFIDQAVNYSKFRFFATPMPVSAIDTCLDDLLDDVDFILLQRNAALGLVSFVMIIFVSRERAKGAQKVMLNAGVPSWSNWTAWLITCFLIELIPCMVMSGILYLVYSGTKATFIMIYLLLTMYCLATDCAYFFIISVISQQDFAKLACAALWLLSHWPYLLGITDFSFKFVTSFLPQMAVIWGYVELEELDETTCSGKVRATDNWSMSATIIFLAADSVIYMLLAWTNDVYFNGCFGREFPINTSKKLSSQTDKNSEHETTIESPVIEEPVVIAIKGLIYRCIANYSQGVVTRLVLTDINIDILRKEVVFILGSDEEELSILTSAMIGQRKPTSGSVTVNGMNPRYIWKIGCHIGVCFEKPYFFAGLSPKENLMFFSMFRGRSMKHATVEADMIMQKLKIQNVSYQYSKSMRKRMSIGMALIGAPPILVLNEPTADLGVNERKDIWKTIDLISRKQTVIVTTRNSDEADNLADRIALLYQGRIQACGTNLWLKQTFGSGYNLSLKREDGNNDKAISAVVQSFVPEAEIIKTDDVLVTYNVPYERRNEITTIINSIEEKKSELGIINIYVELTSLDEIYKNLSSSSSYSLNNYSFVSTIENERYKKHETVRSQVTALIGKKVLYTYRFVAQWKFLGLTTFLFHVGGFAVYSNTIYSFDKDRFNIKIYRYLIGGYLIHDNVPYSLLDMYISGLMKITKTIYHGLKLSDLEDVAIGVEMKQKEDILEMNALYGSWVGDICWKSVNLVTNTALQYIDPEFNIVVQKRIFDIYLIHNSTFEALFFSCFGFVTILAYFPLLPMVEIQDKTKQMQWLSGITDVVYWLVCFSLDIILYVAFACAVVALISYVNEHLGLFDLLAILLVLCMFGLCAIPITYLHVCIFNSYVQVVTCILLQCAISVIINLSFVDHTSDFTTNILNYYPFFGLISAILKVYIQMSENVCVRMKQEINCFYYNHTCCSFPCYDDNCYYVKSYFAFSSAENPHAIGDDLLRFSIGTLLVTILVISLHFNKVRKFLHKFVQKVHFRGSHNSMDDSERSTEIQLAHAVSCHRYSNIYLLALDKVTKIYTRGGYCTLKYFPPVNSVSMTITRGEFFAVIGRNDSGKTVLIKMIVGEEFPSAGRLRLFSNNVGYCPRDVQLFSLFTVHENLMFFAKIRGLSKHNQFCEVHKLLTHFGLYEYRNEFFCDLKKPQMCKMGVAAAMVGDPEFVIMDISNEVLDPYMGKDVWKSIRQIQKPWQSILVTSEVLEDMEGICTSFAVMRNGKFLSATECERIQAERVSLLIVKIYINMSPYNEAQYNLLMEAIDAKFENKLELKLKKTDLLFYTVVDRTVKITTLVKGILELREKFVEVEDFSIQEPSVCCKVFYE